MTLGGPVTRIWRSTSTGPDSVTNIIDIVKKNAWVKRAVTVHVGQFIMLLLVAVVGNNMEVVGSNSSNSPLLDVKIMNF